LKKQTEYNEKKVLYFNEDFFNDRSFYKGKLGKKISLTMKIYKARFFLESKIL